MMLNKIMQFKKIILLSFALVSCAPQGNGILGNQTLLTDIVSQSIKDAPFAYDVAIDTISYNSCISETVKGSEIHGLKIGASEGFTDPLTGAGRTGIKLRTDFLQYIGNKFKAEYPNTTIQPSQIKNILSLSDYNKDAFIQFAIRQKTNFVAVPDLMVLTPTSVAQFPRDMTVLAPILHSGLLGYNISKNIQFTPTGSVLAEGPRVYNLSETVEPVVIEATFNLNATIDESAPPIVTVPAATENFGYAELYPQKVRDEFNLKKNLLTITFGGNQNMPNPMPPADTTNHINLLKRPRLANSVSMDTTKAFGRGFQLTFDSPNPAQPSWLKSQLTKITEINLDNGAPTGGTSWSCENFLIMKPEHWDNNRIFSTTWTQAVKTDGTPQLVEPSCSPIVGPDLTGANGILRQSQIKRLRRHYLSSQWNIGLYLPAAPRTAYTLPPRTTMPLCLTPKAGSCYLPTLGILDDPTRKSLDIGIQYDTTKECYLTSTGGGDLKRDLGRCAQFASLCVRTSSNF